MVYGDEQFLTLAELKHPGFPLLLSNWAQKRCEEVSTVLAAFNRYLPD